jgi:hypothetical protein
VDHLHWLLMDVTKILEQNSEADPTQLGVVVYALTPCENCRYHAAKLLFNHRACPEWLKEECRHDSAEERRELAGATG